MGDVEWIRLAQNMDLWWAPVRAVTKFRFHKML
jgi:hypothetical protein